MNFFGGVAKTSQLNSTFGLGAAPALRLPDLTLTVQRGAGWGQEVGAWLVGSAGDGWRCFLDTIISLNALTKASYN